MSKPTSGCPQICFDILIGPRKLESTHFGVFFFRFAKSDPISVRFGAAFSLCRTRQQGKVPNVIKRRVASELRLEKNGKIERRFFGTSTSAIS
jgi:hypothetical protein